MGRKTLICVRRGTKSKLTDCKLEIGELGFTTDTCQLYIGSKQGNLLLAAGKSKKGSHRLYRKMRKYKYTKKKPEYDINGPIYIILILILFIFNMKNYLRCRYREDD